MNKPYSQIYSYPNYRRQNYRKKNYRNQNYGDQTYRPQRNKRVWLDRELFLIAKEKYYFEHLVEDVISTSEYLYYKMTDFEFGSANLLQKLISYARFDKDILSYLIRNMHKFSLEDIEHVNTEGWTAIMITSLDVYREGFEDLARALIQKGADVTKTHEETNFLVGICYESKNLNFDFFKFVLYKFDKKDETLNTVKKLITDFGPENHMDFVKLVEDYQKE